MYDTVPPLRKRKIDWPNTIVIGLVHLMAVVAILRMTFAHHDLTGWLLFGFLSGFLVVLLYSVSLLGVTLCYHRFLVPTHRSFRVPSRWFRRALLAAAGLSAQGSVRGWVPDHTVHHMYEDQPGRDPHTPDEFLPVGKNHERDEYSVAALVPMRRFWLKLKGCFWAHMGWRIWKQSAFVKTAVDAQRAKLFDTTRSSGHGADIIADLKWQCRWIWPMVIIPGFILPTAIGGIVFGVVDGFHAGLWGAFDFLLIAGFLRLFLSLHATWSVNSAGHIFGTPAKHEPCGCSWEKSHARNCVPLMLITFGEWGHAEHHYDGTCAFFSPRYDPGKWFLLLFEHFGLVTDINRVRKSRRCPVHG